MSHVAENYVYTSPPVPATGWWAGAKPRFSCFVDPQWPFYSSSPNRTVLGSVEMRGRSGSHHTTPDSFGWREPTPYWGYRYCTQAVSIPKLHTWRTADNGVYIRRTKSPVTVSKSVPTGINLTTYRPSFADLQNIAITGCLADLGSAVAELGVELREAHKTADFIGTQLRDLAGFAKDVRNFRIPKAWQKFRRDPVAWASRSFPQRWLEYRYAWSPLVMGIYDSLELLEHQTKRPFLKTARKHAVSETGSSTVGSYSFGSLETFPCTMTFEYKERRDCYVVVTMKMRNDTLTTLNDAGILNPAGIWWETIPFSFVADWFVNVGDYLNACSALATLDFQGGTATHSHTWTTKNTVNSVNEALYIPCSGHFQDSATAGGTSFNRIVLTERDLVPSFHVQNGLNLVRALDAVTLLSSIFRGGSGKGLRV